ncbi:MAG: amidase [Acidiferrobacterales bacterium]|nr:amidase [Acidiferrobacterales bacterium]
MHDNTRTARQYIELMLEGAMSSERLVQHCLDTIGQTDGDIKAWASLDQANAISQARSMDQLRKRGMPTGPLHGIPVGIKDIFDTFDYPTEMNCKAFVNRRPERDSAVVERLREAGAVILGKTVTAELAYMTPPDTRNPRNTEYGPGGSSSGSAAAVAAGQVPLTIGSQTHGSVIRPASYCGIYGYKPTRGVVSRRGALHTSFNLDQVGMFALDLGDLALLGNVVGGYDPTDELCYLRPRPDTLRGYLSEPPIEPIFAWFDLPYSSRYSQLLAEGIEEIIDCLGKLVDRIPAPRSFVGLIESLRRIYGYELYRSLDRLDLLNSDLLSQSMQDAIPEMKKITDEEYSDALEAMRASVDWFENFFNDYDAILTPAAPGIAPKFGEGTGDPCCSTIWTLAGLPCISMPVLVGEDDMPIGLQLVGAAEQEDRLFRTARWLLDFLTQ